METITIMLNIVTDYGLQKTRRIVIQRMNTRIHKSYIKAVTDIRELFKWHTKKGDTNNLSSVGLSIIAAKL